MSPESAWNGAAQTSLLSSALAGGPGDGSVNVTLLDGRAAVAMRAVPVAWREHRIGALAGLRVSGPFSDEESARLSRLAALVALELVEENTFWRIQRAAAELEARTKASSELQEIVRAERDAETLLERATSGLARVFAADGVSIMLVDDGVLSVRVGGFAEIFREVSSQIEKDLAMAEKLALPVTLLLLVLAFPVITIALVFLQFDRFFGTVFYTPSAGRLTLSV